MKKIIVALFFISFFYESSYAHKEWVHQWIIKEAFKVLKKELPEQTFSELEEFLGSDQYWPLGKKEFWYPEADGNSIVRGAYQEDMVDLLWNYGGGVGDGFTASDTHFWDSQDGAGDFTHSNLTVFHYHPPNAFEKANRYLFGLNKFVGDFTIYRSAAHGIPILNYPRGIFWLNSYTLTYPSLCDVYHNASLRFIYGSYYGVGVKRSLHDTPYPLNSTERKIFFYDIFGRILHLLGDMSVPAHTHNDTHPCNGIGVLGIDDDGDRYELFMGNRFVDGLGGDGSSGSACNEDQLDPSNSTQIAPHVLEQGGLIWEVFSMTNAEALRYLFYNTNRLAAHFPSYSVENFLSTGSAGNNSIAHGTNPFLNSMYSQLGDPPNDMTSDDISNAAFRYVIRATATLLYWAEIKLQEISCPTILRLQSDNFFGIEVPPTTKLASFEATQKIIGGNNVFAIDVPIGDYIVHSQALLQLKAGEEISLRDGFAVNAGADFHAFIATPVCQTINGDDGCISDNSGGTIADGATSSFKQSSSVSHVLSSTDTTVNKLFLYIDTAVTISGSINDTIKISQYVASLWDTVDFRGDSLKVGADKFHDTAGVYSITTDTVKILFFANDSLKEEVDTNAIVEVYGNGMVYIYTSSNESKASSGSKLPMTIQLYPNPANRISTVRYNLPFQAMVSIKIYDDLGHEKSVIISNEHQRGGEHSLTYDFSKLPHGNYYLRVEYSGNVKTIQLVSPDK